MLNPLPSPLLTYTHIQTQKSQTSGKKVKLLDLFAIVAVLLSDSSSDFQNP